MEPLATRIVTLANGASMPLDVAAGLLGQLDAMIGHLDAEWDLPFVLREVCLGRDVDRSQLKALIEAKLVGPDGQVPPDTKALVLAALRGEGRALYLSSPFTDTLDRAMADLLRSRNVIRAYLPHDEALATINHDPVAEAIHLLREKTWIERVEKRTDISNDGPPLE